MMKMNVFLVKMKIKYISKMDVIIIAQKFMAL